MITFSSDDSETGAAHERLILPRSVPAQRPPTPRSAPLPSTTPAHRSVPAQPIIGPLRSGFPLRSHAVPNREKQSHGIMDGTRRETESSDNQ